MTDETTSRPLGEEELLTVERMAKQGQSEIMLLPPNVLMRLVWEVRAWRKQFPSKPAESTLQHPS